MAVAVITGGNSGIGRASAVALARIGFDVGITWHREEERAHEAVREIEALGRRSVLETNLTGAFLCAQAAARWMVAAGRGGAIVNVTSVHEHIPLSGSAPYTACKHGLGGLTKVMALELGQYGIRVNSVAPGQIATRMIGHEDEEPQAIDVPLGRAGDAREVGALVAWLCSE